MVARFATSSVARTLACLGTGQHVKQPCAGLGEGFVAKNGLQATVQEVAGDGQTLGKLVSQNRALPQKRRGQRHQAGSPGPCPGAADSTTGAGADISKILTAACHGAGR